jgi:SAM-dependent methyltransferase
VITSLPSGIPTIDAYEKLVRSRDFTRIAEFSDSFLAANRDALRVYRRRWVADPLGQWSRRWEYPFTLGGLTERFGDQRITVLDAGSGVTFLPYLLADRMRAEVHCCDHDTDLAEVFDRVNQRCAAPVTFAAADLRDLPYESASFDAVYCVSVLEHTDRRGDIVRELHRVLRPGGLLLLTFDLPTEPPDDDPEHTAMIAALDALFDSDSPLDTRRGAGRPGTLTTAYAASVDRRLLPWRHPTLYRLSCLISGHGWISWPPGLTVACLRLTKRGQP